MLHTTSHKLIALLLLGIMAGITACSKGELIKAPDVTVFRVNISSAKTDMLYTIWLDGISIGDSLVNGAGIVKIVEKKSTPQYIAIKSAAGKTLLDTAVNLAKPAANYVYLDLDET
ncbi:MAG TPA: hypothetical protein VM802_01500, partial [Chitinophaga sp.]|uniref:hypothetical protein n=1 Tax=Chitinophaga sp. TaxID=1869181 RepID=UPI002C1BDF27